MTRFETELAKTSRAHCRGCRGPIKKDALRVAARVPDLIKKKNRDYKSNVRDTEWFHPSMYISLCTLTI